MEAAGAADAADGADSTSASGRRRYELWYTLLSSVDGALLMREPRQYISEQQMAEALHADEQPDDDEDELGLTQAPSILVTADDSSTAHYPYEQSHNGKLQACGRSSYTASEDGPRGGSSGRSAHEQTAR